MPLDPEKLLAFNIPSGRQTLSPRDVALYALSIGMGQNPVNERELEFIDVNHDIKVVPSMAFVMAHPGFWFADPATSIDVSGMLHADQSMELLAPFFPQDSITSTTKVTELIDKGPGKAALMRTETLLRNDRDEMVARLLRTVFLRGAGGFGGKNEQFAIAEVSPQRKPDHVVEFSTRPEQALLYRLNGDLNPLHADPAFARKAGFERPILHGLCTAAIACHAVLRAVLSYDEQALKYFHVRFTGVVLPGETIRTEIWNEGYFRVRATERDVIAIDNGRFTLKESAAPSTPLNEKNS